MSRAVLLTILMFGSMVSYGQNISVTFTGTGAATQIDSVTATNLTTNQSITLPGNETLVLSINTGIPSVFELTNLGMVFPNPFPGRATFTMMVQNPQTVYLKVQNLVGQVVAQTKAFIQSGENEFTLSVNTAGIYLVTLTTEQGTASYKVICTNGSAQGNIIQYLGSVPNNHNNHNNSFQSELKSSQSGYNLGYRAGDVIHYRCRSGIYTTIMTDSPNSSKNYEVEFVTCTDPDEKNYSIVKLGDQTWMAENLAYLPSVSQSSTGSETTPYYYVYGYDGTSIGEAKATINFSTYGVLYNWLAAMDGASSSTLVPSGVKGICPSGWHLPSDVEWTTLTDFLGTAAGGKMKETGTTHWVSPNAGATNESGFTALPGGYLDYSGGFNHLGTNAVFWSSSEDGSSSAWERDLSFDGNGVNRFNDYRRYGFSVRCLLGAGLPKVTTEGITAITETSATSGGNITNDGGAIITARGVCWATDTDAPTTDHPKTTDGTGINSFTSNITGLTGNTRYFVRAYATNTVGTAYGGTIEFTTDGGGVDSTFTDSRDGKVYKKVKIGTQTWMAENLAYLPTVNPYSASSNTTPYNYVYGYNGTTVSAAKATANYTTYGVLYNWPAAMNGASTSNSVPSGVQGICPSGWHLPSDAEWTILTDYLTNNGYGYGGSGSDIGKSMASLSGWTSYSTAGTIGNNQASNNSSGFTALPGGYSLSGGFYGLGDSGLFWSASESDASFAWHRGLHFHLDGVYRGTSDRSSGFSVRCLLGAGLPKVTTKGITAITETSATSGGNITSDGGASITARGVCWATSSTPTTDDSKTSDGTGTGSFTSSLASLTNNTTYYVRAYATNSAGTAYGDQKQFITSGGGGDGTFTDSRDGHNYPYKTIGEQTWMTENLAWLPSVNPSSVNSYTTPYYYVYGYEGSTVASAKATANYTTYGVLYNWPAALTACPSGWHLPTDEEWKILEKNQGMTISDADASGWRNSGTVGGKLKETGTHWSSPNTGATNSSGFTALPGGLSRSGGFYYLGSHAYFWSASEDDASGPWYRGLYYVSDGVNRYGGKHSVGFSVRCLQN